MNFTKVAYGKNSISFYYREESSQTKKENLESVKEKLSRLQQEDTKLREEERGIVVEIVWCVSMNATAYSSLR